MATFVLVHGATQGGHRLRRVRALLAEAGHEAFTPTLTGLGERVHLSSPGIDLETHVLDVLNVLRYEDLRGVVLVGFSYGGMVITGVADRAPERIGHLMYVDAAVPRDGESYLDVLPPNERARHQSQIERNPADWRLPHVALDPLSTAQPKRTYTQPLRLSGREGKDPSMASAPPIPTTYIRCTRPNPSSDRMAPSARRARSAVGWRWRELPCGHAAGDEMPRELTALLMEAAETA